MRKTGKRTASPLNLQVLESRELPATASLVGTTLVVEGTNASETIVVRQQGTRISVDGASIRNGTRMDPFLDTTRVRSVIVRDHGGDDTINVSTLQINAMVWGGPGNDRIYGGNGNDILYGDQGNDMILGANGNDWLYGGDGNDQIWGGAGHDWISGDNGNDRLSGDSGNDTINGGEGRDTLIGGSGIDVLDGHGFGLGAANAERNFDTYQDDFDLWRPISASDQQLFRKGQLDDTGYLASLASLSEADVKAAIRVISRGVYDVTLPGDRRTIRVNFDGTWTDNDPRPSQVETPSFAMILLNRARLISFGIDPTRYFTKAQWDAHNVRTGNRLYDPAHALRQFTGRTVSQLNSVSADFATLKNRLDRGAAAVVSSFRSDKSTANTFGIMGNTRYAVKRLFTDSYGRRWVELFNPLGTDCGDGRLLDRAPGMKQQNDGMITILFDDFRRASNFTTIWIA